MSPETRQAFELLVRATASIHGTRADHEAIAAALRTVEAALARPTKEAGDANA